MGSGNEIVKDPGFLRIGTHSLKSFQEDLSLRISRTKKRTSTPAGSQSAKLSLQARTLLETTVAEIIMSTKIKLVDLGGLGVRRHP